MHTVDSELIQQKHTENTDQFQSKFNITFLIQCVVWTKLIISHNGEGVSLLTLRMFYPSSATWRNLG